ncbi:MAG: hypothetical protein IPI40_03315 [Betaproteobacteria bacterium]|nr:hypothetical protein [Betaproteobacteria bacterium]
MRSLLMMHYTVRADAVEHLGNDAARGAGGGDQSTTCASGSACAAAWRLQHPQH